ANLSPTTTRKPAWLTGFHQEAPKASTPPDFTRNDGVPGSSPGVGFTKTPAKWRCRRIRCAPGQAPGAIERATGALLNFLWFRARAGDGRYRFLLPGGCLACSRKARQPQSLEFSPDRRL